MEIMAITFLSAENYDASIKRGLVFVEFGSEMCGPCKLMEHTLEDLRDRLHGVIKVFRVDVQSEPELAKQFNILSVPTTLAYNEGRLQGTAVGVQSSSSLLDILGV